MLEILGYLLLGLLLAIAVILIAASRRPDVFRISRTARVTAPPDRLFGLINDLRRMNTWNPYALRDPSGAVGYSGPNFGPGSSFRFEGKKSGTGSIEILDAKQPSSVTMRLKMDKPFKADNTVEFTLRPNGAETEVSWAMSGRQPILAKCMTLFIDCDKMVGRDFEEGLANLKAIAERA